MLVHSIIPMVLITVLLQEEYIGCVKAKRRDCVEQCGDVLIEYPFGIGTNCSYDNDYFAVTCDNSSLHHKPKPILTKLKVELIEIQNLYPLGQVTVNMRVPKICSPNKRNAPHDEILRIGINNLNGSPFDFDTSQNVFVAVGCSWNASLYEEPGHYLIGGCSSTCNPPGQVVDRCNGYYCCQSDLRDTSNLNQEYAVRMSSVGDGGGGCRSAFLTSRTYLQINSTVGAAMNVDSVVPVVLWFLQRDLVLGTLLVSCCCFWSYWLWRTKERRKEVKLRAKYFMGRLKERATDREVVEKTKLFTINELKRATDNFNGDRILGRGGQGTVYKGMLTNGQVVAIKRSKTYDENQWKQFINEVILLSLVSHKNVVKLLGCCLESKIPLLVYEFVPNGTLSLHIHNSTSENMLTWEMRLRIAFEVASAIAYLHSSSSTPIYHRDVKPTNILLDEKYQAKVADFGISKAVCMDQTHITTCVQGTFGYLDPEYFESSQFSEKSDVYSFGVILVELLTGQEPIRASTSEEERSLIEYFISAMNRLCLDAILDPIVLQGSTRDMIMSVAVLAKQCLHERGLGRPTMKEVAIELERLVKKTSMAVVLDQQVAIEIEEVVDQSNRETHNTRTSPAICGDVSVNEIHSEGQPSFRTT